MRLVTAAVSAAVFSLVLGIASAPVPLPFDASPAFAKGNGGGGGAGGGKGGGRAGGAEGAGRGAAPSTAASARDLGGLNAAHASPSALGHAAPESTVGRIAAYHDLMSRSAEAADPVTRAALRVQAMDALTAAANKPVTPGVAGRVDGILGGAN
jgi:hypothetical protein